jgi:branched-chain amino acid transport system ATP-binding protein
MSHEAEGMKLIECRDIAVRFGGLKALSDLSLAINEGEVLGIAGPNGAGKTTLFNVISGHVRPASGDVIFRGQTITGLAPHKIFQLGLARTFQLAEVIGSQDIYANVLVGAHFARDTQLRTSLIFDDESHAAAQEALRSHELAERSRDLASKTSLYQRKLVMLASALAHAPQAVLLDEPVSGLTPAQAKSIVEHIERVRLQGTTVVVIEHVMRVLMAIAERLVILNRGRIIFDGSPEKVRENEEVQRLYLGSAAGGLA